MAKEWGSYKVTVNAVGFGLIDTRLIKPMDDPETQHQPLAEKRSRRDAGEVRDTVLMLSPSRTIWALSRMRQMPFLFLLPTSDYVTGEVLICGGGIHF